MSLGGCRKVAPGEAELTGGGHAVKLCEVGVAHAGDLLLEKSLIGLFNL
jgi:hypothetical protein